MRLCALAMGTTLIVGAGVCAAADGPGSAQSDRPETTAALPEGAEAPIQVRATPRPEYPSAARIDRREGRVILRFVVRKDGTTDVQEVLSCETRKKRKRKYRDDPTKECFGFAESARNAVSKWRFVPATIRGEAVEVTRVTVVEFELQ